MRRFLRFRQNGITEQPLTEKKFLGFLKEHYGVINKITRAYVRFFTAICVATKVFFPSQPFRNRSIKRRRYTYWDFFRLASQLVTAFEPWQN